MAKYKYTADELIEFDLQIRPGGYFCNEWLLIWRSEPPDKSGMVISKGYSWDGCSFAPDFKGTKKASAGHDAPYQYAEDIADEWGWTVRQVLIWADHVFYQQMIIDGCNPTIAALYYRGVRWFGYAYHVAARWLRKIFRRPFWLVCICVLHIRTEREKPSELRGHRKTDLARQTR